MKIVGEPPIQREQLPIKRPVRPVRVGSLRVVFEHRGNGVAYVRSTELLGDYPPRITDPLESWARQTPDRIFLAQRAPSGDWETATYYDAWVRVRRLAGGLLREGLSPSQPLIILSGNSIEHALLALAATYVGIPYAPIAPSYSLGVRNYGALRQVWQDLSPGMVFVQEGSLFAPTLKAVMRDRIRVVHHGSAPDGFHSLALADLENTGPSSKVDEANDQVGPDSIAKILYTSGSTGLPKGVITTHRMLSSNQQMIRQVMPCLAEEPPVVCDWLPWNHTFGGSHNFGIVLYNGGSLYIDKGGPTAELFAETGHNLREIAPTAYFNVPKGYEMLVQNLRADTVLRRTFFSRLQLLFFAAAGLNQRTWDELQEIAFETCGEQILVVTGLGATESAPFAFSTGIEGSSSGRIELPVPGVEVKLVTSGEHTEARLRGPSITPGYWQRPDLNRIAFDEENYYRMGDAVRLVDPADPQKGFVFDGRLNEDFKLSSGTWVRAGMLRLRLLAHFDGLVLDAVLAGPDRGYVVALFFPALESCRRLCPELKVTASVPEVLGHAEVRAVFQERLNSFAAVNHASSTRVQRAILVDPPLKHRAAVVDRLYQEPVASDVFDVPKELCHTC